MLIDIRRAEDARDVVHQAVQALAEGQLVVFPTETVYGIAASALSDEAIGRLLAVKGRQEGQPLALAIKSADDALDYVPRLSPLGRRLARRCWPGPLTLVVDNDHHDSLLARLPPLARKAIVPNGSVGLRVPAHALILDALRMLAGPVALSSANRTGGPEPLTAQQVVDTLGSDVPLIFDDGASRFGQPSSVVRVRNGSLEVLREGVVSQSTLRRLASYLLVFVCTGNTCRSPMAEALARKLIAQRLKCRPEELEDRGVLVASAGMAAALGGRPSPQAVEVLRAQGLDLSQHESQPLGEQLVRHADLILTMTRGHRDAILVQWPTAAPRVQVLREDENDVPDPVGGPAELYARCAEQIEAELKHWIPRLELQRMNIAIGCDHRGVEVKQKLVELLGSLGHQVIDEGTRSAESVDYPDIARRVAEHVSRADADRGILICGTGIGMAIAANKIPGVRAAPCHDDLTAEMSRRHNDLNVLCLSADMLGERLIDRMVEIWLTTEFEGGRHARRVQKIAELEQHAGEAEA